MKPTILSLLILAFSTAFSQTTDDQIREDYLMVQSGFMIDGYNSVGVRTFFEYQKELGGRWRYGIAYDHTRHLGQFMTDQLHELPSNLSLLSFNAYYKLPLFDDRVFWTMGMGFGPMHVYWSGKDRFGLAVNASINLNVRVTKRIYLVTAPLAIFPPANRIYFWPMKKIKHFNHFRAFTFFPFGVKVKL